MALSSEKIEFISYQVIKTLYKRFELFPDDPSGIRNAPFHMAFLNAFRNKLEEHVTDIPVFISLSSWFHGLNTTLGQSFFEKVSHILCDGVKREFKAILISRQQQNAVSEIITNLNNRKDTPNITKENLQIYSNNYVLNTDSENFIADCYFEDETRIVAIELKTVKPNKGVFKNEKAKILLAKAGLKNLNPTKEIFFYLGFPFDPISSIPTGSNKAAFMNYSVDFTKFFAPDEVLIADNLWDFLSGDSNTMNQIIEIINKIATPQFMDKFEYLNNTQNKILDRNLYLKHLNDWNMFSEIKLIKNEAELLNRIKSDKRMIRKYNQPMFKECDYNVERFTALEKILN